MRTINGNLSLAIAYPTTALVLKEYGKETVLGFCLGVEASTKTEDVEKIIPVSARSGRVFYRNRKAEEEELRPDRYLVVPTRYEIGAKSSHYSVVMTDDQEVVILDFTDSKDRFVVFRDTTHGDIIVVDLEAEKGWLTYLHDIISYDIVSYDLVLSEAACPIPSWDAKNGKYTFGDNDFVPVVLPTWHDNWFGSPTTEPLFPPFSDQTDSSLESFSPFEEAPFASQN